MNDTRESFESWLSDGCATDQIRKEMLSKLPNGEYRSQLTFAGFKGWQASAQSQQAKIDNLHNTNRALLAANECFEHDEELWREQVENLSARALEESNKYVAYCDLAESRITALEAQVKDLQKYKDRH